MANKMQIDESCINDKKLNLQAKEDKKMRKYPTTIVYLTVSLFYIWQNINTRQDTELKTM